MAFAESVPHGQETREGKVRCYNDKDKEREQVRDKNFHYRAAHCYSVSQI